MRAIFEVVLLIVCMTMGTSVAGEEEFTPQEKKLIEKFKASVIPKIPASSHLQNYRNDDLYFLRWLKAQGLRVEAAEKAFMKHLKWREAERIDKIHEEDWSAFQADFPIFMDTFDRTGRPSAELWFTEWNPRKVVTSGKAKQLERWFLRLFELQSRRLYSARAGGSSNITDLMILCDLKGFKAFQHACVSCIPVYARVVTTFENHYTGIYKNGIFTDVPWAFGALWDVISPLMSAQTRQRVKMYSKKSEWGPVLDKLFDKGQRSIRFGGTLTRSVL